MATSSTGITLFPGVESQEEMFIATMEEYDRSMGVEHFIDIEDELWIAMRNLGGIEYKDSPGTYVKIPMNARENSTVKSFAHYDDVDNTPQDSLEEGRAQFGQVVGTQMYSFHEMMTNSGKHQIIDLVENKYDVLQTSMNNYVANLVGGTQAADGRNFDGLGRVVTQGVSLHGIDPTDATKPWAADYWQPVRTYKTGTTAFALATEFRDGVRKFSRAVRRYNKMGKMLFVCGEDVFDAFQSWSEEKVRMTYSEIEKSEKWGDAEAIKQYGNRTVVYSDRLAEKEMWGLNMAKTKFRILKGANFTPQPWQQMEGKVAKKRDVILFMALVCRDRRANGKIVFS